MAAGRETCTGMDGQETDVCCWEKPGRAENMGDYIRHRELPAGKEESMMDDMKRALEGEHHASPGDYIIKGVNGEFYPCKPGIFVKPYESAALTPPNEWVSVEERLPPEHEPVLCIVNGKPKPNITLEEAYQLGSWNKADGWIIDEYLDWEDAVVLWWMPLPEPPGKEG